MINPSGAHDEAKAQGGITVPATATGLATAARVATAAGPATGDGTAAIFHITESSLWEEAHRMGSYEWSTRGLLRADVGFIHCSQAHQVERVGQFVYGSMAGPGEAEHDPTGAARQKALGAHTGPIERDLVVLHLDPRLIPNREAVLRWEDGGTGELFPHLYRSLDPAWVVGAHPARVDCEGNFSWDQDRLPEPQHPFQ